MRGLTVEDAAAALEVKAPSLYYWERTGGMPRDPAVVQRITQFYDVALTEIWPVQEAAA